MREWCGQLWDHTFACKLASADRPLTTIVAAAIHLVTTRRSSISMANDANSCNLAGKGTEYGH